MFNTRTRRYGLAAVLVALLVVAAACTAGDEASSGQLSDASGGGGPDGAAEERAAVPQADGDDAADGDEAADAGAVQRPGAGNGSDPAPLPAVDRPASAERIIKEGTMTVEVEQGGYHAAFDRIVAATRRLGGTVVASTATSDPDAGTSGSVTVRVPVDRYEELLSAVGGVGELRRQEITSQDVTGEYVDLQSRLRHLRAQEAFYLELLEQAETVQDAIAVQQHLEGIQERIEQIQGRLNVLEDRTSFSTLTVELIETGAEPVLAGTDTPDLARYWDTGVRALLTLIGWGIVVAISLAPLWALLLGGLVVWRLGRRRAAAAAR